MAALHDIQFRLVDGEDSIGARLRKKRWDLFQEHLPDFATMRVLDLGGPAETWLRAPVRGARRQLEPTPLDLPLDHWGAG